MKLFIIVFTCKCWKLNGIRFNKQIWWNAINPKPSHTHILDNSQILRLHKETRRFDAVHSFLNVLRKMLLLNVRPAAQTFLSVTHTQTPTFPPTKHLLTSKHTYTHTLTHAQALRKCVSGGHPQMVQLQSSILLTPPYHLHACVDISKKQWIHSSESPFLSLCGRLGVHYFVIYLVEWPEEKRIAVFTSSSMF